MIFTVPLNGTQPAPTATDSLYRVAQTIPPSVGQMIEAKIAPIVQLHASLDQLLKFYEQNAPSFLQVYERATQEHSASNVSALQTKCEHFYRDLSEEHRRVAAAYRDVEHFCKHHVNEEDAGKKLLKYYKSRAEENEHDARALAQASTGRVQVDKLDSKKMRETFAAKEADFREQVAGAAEFEKVSREFYEKIVGQLLANPT